MTHNSLKPPYRLEYLEGRLTLISSLDPKIKIYAEFLRGPMGYRRQHGGGLHQLIAKAVGLKKKSDTLKILDATAGLGQDAFVLATLNCQVILVERSPVIAALLEDGLKRAASDPKVKENVLSKMQVVVDDAKNVLMTYFCTASDDTTNVPTPNKPDSSLCTPPDVVYLDPMFPTSRKKALTKIEMRIIRDIVGADEDAESLLFIARKAAKKRVVVKRPLKAQPIANLKPDFVVEGQRNRYDVYLS